jgi:hypothetical protein
MTRVVFRKFKDGDVIAIFPDIKESGKYVASYMHLGQHGACCSSLIDELEKPTLEEWKPLHEELIKIGYNDLVIQNY